MEEESKVDQVKKASEEDRSTVAYWHQFVRAGKKAAKRHWTDAEEAYREYEIREDCIYPIYKISADKLVSAIYGKDGEPRSRRRFGIDDSLALTAAMINDRLGEHLMEEGSFYEAIQAATHDLVHGSKGATQVLYAADTETSRVVVERGANGEGYYAEDGSPYSGEVLEDEEGTYYEEKIAKNKRIRLAPLPFDEVIHTPEAKCGDEVYEIGYKFKLGKEEAEKLFNPDGTKQLPYKTIKSTREDHETAGDDEDNYESERQVLEGWECYCLHSRKIYWVSLDYNDFLKVSDDKYKLRKFFPSPKFALINKRRKSLYPTTAWSYLKSTADQLSELYSRCFNLIKAVEPKCLVHGASEDLIELLNSRGGTYISAGKMLDILEKGNLENLMQFIPVRELVEALRLAITVEEHFNNKFYEFYHLPDVLRGQTAVEKTASEVQINQDEAHDTFRTIRERVVKLARDSLELMLDLAYQVMTDEEIAEIVGYQFLPMGTPAVPAQPGSEQNPQGVPAVPPEPGHKERFFDALELLRSDRQRIIRIDFETNSTSFKKDAQEIQKSQVISTMLTQGLGFIQSIQQPQYIPVAMNMLLNTMEAIGGSSKIEDMVRRAQKEINEAKKNPPPPPPDYEQMKIQVKQQEMQMKGQESQAKTQMEGVRLKLDAQESQGKQSIESALMQIRALEVNAKIEMEQVKQAFSQQLEGALIQLEQQRVEIERYSALLSAQESLLEEVRLRQESDSAMVSQAIEVSQSGQERRAEAPSPQVLQLPASEPPNFNITVQMPPPGQRKARITKSDGSITEVDVGDAG